MVGFVKSSPGSQARGDKTQHTLAEHFVCFLLFDNSFLGGRGGCGCDCFVVGKGSSGACKVVEDKSC